MSANIYDILKEKFANVDMEQIAMQIDEEIKKSTENMENKLETGTMVKTGTIMDGIMQTNIQKQAKEELNTAQIEQIMTLYKNAHTPKVKENKIGRNDKCPCGSGKKYKDCCLSSGKYENYINKK